MKAFVLLVLFRRFYSLEVAKFERACVLKAANVFLKVAPITITASVSPRSAGGCTASSPKASTGGPTHRLRTVLTFNGMECRVEMVWRLCTVADDKQERHDTLASSGFNSGHKAVCF